MHEIHAQDQIINDFEEIKIEASCHFSAIYTAETSINMENGIMELVPKIVKIKENDNLIERITLDELKIAVDDMKDDKVPGSNGFNENFIKAC